MRFHEISTKIVDFYRICIEKANLSTGGLGYCKKACTPALETIMVSWYVLDGVLKWILSWRFLKIAFR